MPYYLRHFFRPDFDHTRLRPIPMADGNVDDRYLGYVQTVLAGQVLAQVEQISDEQAENARIEEEKYPRHATSPPEEGYDVRFISDERLFPLGPNCRMDRHDPNAIVAACNGLCFYHKGLITVKSLLNVRSDVGFRTGNILFGGDVAVHGDVYPGFQVRGANVLVKGRIDGGEVKARYKVTCEGGLKGSPKALVTGDDVRLGFCEHAVVRTRGNLFIEGNCLHSDLYVGGSLIVGGILRGGSVNARNLVFVRCELGGGRESPTRVQLGYDPELIRKVEVLTEIIEAEQNLIRTHESRISMNPLCAKDLAPLLEIATLKRDEARSQRDLIAESLRAEDFSQARCRVVVSGQVRPGVSISIGLATTRINEEDSDTYYCLQDGAVQQGHPALTPGSNLLRMIEQHV